MAANSKNYKRLLNNYLAQKEQRKVTTMIAMVKATGKVINVVHFKAVAGNNLYKDTDSGIDYHPEELESIEQVRIQAAIAAMQGMMASEFYCTTKTRNDSSFTKYREKWDGRTIAREAVACADALVAELKKGGENV